MFLIVMSSIYVILWHVSATTPPPPACIEVPPAALNTPPEIFSLAPLPNGLKYCCLDELNMKRLTCNGEFLAKQCVEKNPGWIAFVISLFAGPSASLTSLAVTYLVSYFTTQTASAFIEKGGWWATTGAVLSFLKSSTIAMLTEFVTSGTGEVFGYKFSFANWLFKSLFGYNSTTDEIAATFAGWGLSWIFNVFKDAMVCLVTEQMKMFAPQFWIVKILSGIGMEKLSNAVQKWLEAHPWMLNIFIAICCYLVLLNLLFAICWKISDKLSIEWGPSVKRPDPPFAVLFLYFWWKSFQAASEFLIGIVTKTFWCVWYLLVFSFAGLVAAVNFLPCFVEYTQPVHVYYPSLGGRVTWAQFWYSAVALLSHLLGAVLDSTIVSLLPQGFQTPLSEQDARKLHQTMLLNTASAALKKLLDAFKKIQGEAGNLSEALGITLQGAVAHVKAHIGAQDNSSISEKIWYIRQLGVHPSQATASMIHNLCYVSCDSENAVFRFAAGSSALLKVPLEALALCEFGIQDSTFKVKLFHRLDKQIIDQVLSEMREIDSLEVRSEMKKAKLAKRATQNETASQTMLSSPAPQYVGGAPVIVASSPGVSIPSARAAVSSASAALTIAPPSTRKSNQQPQTSDSDIDMTLGAAIQKRRAHTPAGGSAAAQPRHGSASSNGLCAYSTAIGLFGSLSPVLSGSRGDGSSVHERITFIHQGVVNEHIHIDPLSTTRSKTSPLTPQDYARRLATDTDRFDSDSNTALPSDLFIHVLEPLNPLSCGTFNGKEVSFKELYVHSLDYNEVKNVIGASVFTAQKNLTNPDPENDHYEYVPYVNGLWSAPSTSKSSVLASSTLQVPKPELCEIRYFGLSPLGLEILASVPSSGINHSPVSVSDSPSPSEHDLVLEAERPSSSPSRLPQTKSSTKYSVLAFALSLVLVFIVTRFQLFSAVWSNDALTTFFYSQRRHREGANLVETFVGSDISTIDAMRTLLASFNDTALAPFFNDNVRIISPADYACMKPDERSSFKKNFRSIVSVCQYPQSHFLGETFYVITRGAEHSRGLLSNWLCGNARFDLASTNGFIHNDTSASSDCRNNVNFCFGETDLHHEQDVLFTVFVSKVRVVSFVRCSVKIFPAEVPYVDGLDEQHDFVEQAVGSSSSSTTPATYTPRLGSAPTCCECNSSSSTHYNSKSTACNICGKVAFGSCGARGRGAAATWMCGSCKSTMSSSSEQRSTTISSRQLATALRALIASLCSDETTERSALQVGCFDEFKQIKTDYLLVFAASPQTPSPARPPASPPSSRAPLTTAPAASSSSVAPPPLPPDSGIPPSNYVTAPAPLDPRLASESFVPSAEHFRISRTQVPSPALNLTGPLTAQFLMDLELRAAQKCESGTTVMHEEALVAQTRAQHRLRIRDVLEYLQEHPTACCFPLGAVTAQALCELGHQRRWQWQTLHRAMCSAVGAFNSLPLYSNSEQTVALAACPYFRACLAFVKQRAQESQPRDQTAVSQSQIEMAVEAAPHAWQQVALILMWLTSCRVGCVLQLRLQDIRFQPSEGSASSNSIQLLTHFAHGKGVKMRGPYTVHSTLAQGPWLDLLVNYLHLRRSQQRARPADLLFPATTSTTFTQRTTHLRIAVRAADPSLNLRAMRRGSLQAVSLIPGTTVDQLMLRAGHTSPATTRRYLGFGLKDMEAARNSVSQTLPLQPASRGPPPPYTA